MSRTIIIQHNDHEYGGQIGTIKATHLGFEDHGIMTADLVVEWQGGGVSVGGYCLDSFDRSTTPASRRGTAYGLDHIIQIMRTVGVEKWEELKGKQVIVLFEGTSFLGAQSVGIASTTDESRVLIMKEHADKWKAAEK